MPLIITIDVECWAQSTLSRDMPITDRAQRNFEHLLDVLAETGGKASCFVLGLFAERFPETVRRIVTEGHELGSHGYGHEHVFKLSPEKFREDIRRSKGQLEDIAGNPVIGYRAPFFSIVKDSFWALPILAEEGFIYDSSIYPVKNPNYGVPEWPRQPVKLLYPENLNLLEIPIATTSFSGRNLPVAGGGYHRLLPWPFIKLAIKRNLKRGEVFTAYCHPYEFDPEEFANLTYKLPLKIKLHQGLGRAGFERKFRKMISSFDSCRIDHLIEDSQWPETKIESIIQ